MRELIFPTKMRTGQKIGIFASSSPALSFPNANDSYKYINAKGVNVFEHKQCRIKNRHTAGTVVDRVSAINDLLLDNSIGILMAYWGGTNTNDLLKYLDYELFARYPKIIIGYSDTTALLQAITSKTGLVTFMGPAAITFIKPEPFEYSWSYFYKMCIAPEDEVVIEDSPVFADDEYFLREDSNHRIIRPNSGRQVFKDGNFKGACIASNLETLLALAGTEYFPNLEGKALFIEESEEENVSTVNRNFRQLSQADGFDKLGAMLIGRFCEKSGFSDQDSVEMMLEDTLANTNFPVIYNLDFGHSDPLFTIPNGGSVVIDTKQKVLQFSKAVV